MKHQAPYKPWFRPVSSAAALALLLAAGHATALGLGSIHVRSNLGEVFRADVDINAITAAEAEGLRVNMADAIAYEAAGLEMNSALQGASVSLEKSADGRSYLRINGVKPVNDPFLDLLIQTDNVQSGRATRGYTVLIDPPAGLMKAPKITAPALPVESKAPRIKPQPVAPQPKVEAVPAPVPSAEATTKTVPPAAPAHAGEGSRVQRGSTAGSIARQMAAQQGVSYDQMLAALVRQNPDAFIGGNVNRIKAGAVLQTPSAEQATSVSQSEAKRQWMASGNNFKQYRRRLAQMDGSSVDANAGRTSRGAVAGEAADQGSTKAAGDKLTLGKARASRRNTEDQVLRKRHRAESSARQAELSKNIEELKKLSGATGKAAAPAAAHEAAAVNAAPKKNAPGLSVAAPILSAKTEAQKAQAKQETSMTAAPAVSATPTPSPTVVAAALAATVAPAEHTASAPAEQASAAHAAASAASESASAVLAVASPEPSPVAKAPVQKPVLETPSDAGSWMDKLSGLALPLGGLLGAGALGGLGFALLRRRKKQGAGAVDSAAFLESKLEADSFFDASGGQRIDTSAHSSGVSSSMVYSPSQLDAAGDVDPVAEAGVYMAYNRDQQAEDILKEAMRITPSRVAIYTTLMEIYAKRGDLKAFDVVAREAQHLTGGQGDEWANALKLGRQADPANPLFADEVVSTAAPEEEGDRPVFERPAAAPTAPMSLEQAQETAKLEAADLDMVFRNSDFKLSQGQAEQDEEVSTPTQLQTAPMQMESSASATPASDAPTSHMDLSFDLDIPVVPVEAAQASAAGVDMQFTEAALSGHAPIAADEPLKFDMSDLSLDLGDSVTPAPAAALPADPWLTKLELAREFVALGDSDGARAMAEEVVANAPADVADQARTFIATMV